jgi:hypothetical protein
MRKITNDESVKIKMYFCFCIFGGRFFERDKTFVKGHQGNWEGEGRAKDTSKPPGGSATAVSTTRDGGRGWVKEGTRGTEPPDTEAPAVTTENYHGGHRQGGRGGGRGGHSGCWHPNGASSSLELDVLRKRGKSVSPTEYTFSESFMNGCKKSKTRM